MSPLARGRSRETRETGSASGYLPEKASGMSVLIVEQHALSVLDITDRAYVLDKGRNVYVGPSAELRNDAALRHRLLGA